jgi:hypothetical protein
MGFSWQKSQNIVFIFDGVRIYLINQFYFLIKLIIDVFFYNLIVKILFSKVDNLQDQS